MDVYLYQFLISETSILKKKTFQKIPFFPPGSNSKQTIFKDGLCFCLLFCMMCYWLFTAKKVLSCDSSNGTWNW